MLHSCRKTRRLGVISRCCRRNVFRINRKYCRRVLYSLY